MKIDLTKKEVAHLKITLLTGCEICVSIIDKLGGYGDYHDNLKEVYEDREEEE